MSALHPKTILITLVFLSITPSLAIATDIDILNEEINRCAKLHEFDPECTEDLDEYELGTNERIFLECVYTSIHEKLIPSSLVPTDFENLVTKHKQMTDAVEQQELTRDERTLKTTEILNQIKANEAAETERRIQDLSAKRDRFLRDREKMLKRNPRMF